MNSTPQPHKQVVSVPTETHVPDIDVLASIGFSWRELRRGAVADRLRDKLFGEGDSALDPGQVDTLDLLCASTLRRRRAQSSGSKNSTLPDVAPFRVTVASSRSAPPQRDANAMPSSVSGASRQ
jgi:hypothetical protein